MSLRELISHFQDKSCLGIFAAGVTSTIAWIQGVNWAGAIATASGVLLTAATTMVTIIVMVRSKLSEQQRAAEKSADSQQREAERVAREDREAQDAKRLEAERVAREERHKWEVRVRDERLEFEKHTRADQLAFELANRDSLTEQLRHAEAERHELMERIGSQTVQIAELTEIVRDGRKGNHEYREQSIAANAALQHQIMDLQDKITVMTRELEFSRAHVDDLTAEIARLIAVPVPVPMAQVVALDRNTAATDRNTESADVRDVRDHPTPPKEGA